MASKLHQLISYRNRNQVLDILYARTYDPLSVDTYKRTLLMIAINSRMPDIALALLSDPLNCINLDKCDDVGMTALMYAVICDQDDVVYEILKYSDNNKQARDNRGMTAKQYAEIYNKPHIVNALNQCD